MKIVSRDWVIEQKQKRRESIGLDYHANGDCVHTGKISRGCKTCFVRNPLSSFAIYTGCECNLNCGYCYYDKNRNDSSWKSNDSIISNLSQLYALTMNPQADIQEVTYNSYGETLKYPAIIKEASDMIKRYEKDTGKKVYSHLYTNGTLANEEALHFLKTCGIIEIRFHPSASNFSKQVLGNMKLAKEMGFIVTVEEPSLPENKIALMANLEYFNEIGINHLDIIECKITKDNMEYLETTYPKGKMYRDVYWHLYDEGMVYDIIEEVKRKAYIMSVIDCNSRVEGCRTADQMGTLFEVYDTNMMDGACNEQF